MQIIKPKYCLLLMALAVLLQLPISAQDINKNASAQLIKDSKLLNQAYTSVLYKAGVEVYGRYFSGIYLFKQLPADSAFRIVMLSEFGLSFFDFKYKNETFSVESCQDFLNKPMLLKMMQKDLKLLLSEIDKPEKIKQVSKKNFDGQVYKFKYKSDKYYYFYDPNNKLGKVIVKEGLFKKANITINGYDNSIPKQIIIDRNRQKLKVSLSLLKTEE